MRPIVEIVIQRRFSPDQSTWPVVVERTVSGSFLTIRTEGVLALSDQALRACIDAQDYGILLGKALFAGPVLRAFDRALAETDDGIRVLLTVEAPELQRLHWERLCAPLHGETWSFIARDQRTPFSFYLPSTTDRRFPTLGRRDLRALVVVASPHAPQYPRVRPFHVPAAVAAAQRGLAPIPLKVLALEGGDGSQPVQVPPGSVGPPTLDELCRQLTEEHYALLHLVCHGCYNSAEGETVLYLSHADNSVAPVTAQALIERLRALQGPRGLPHFAFLSTCESAVIEGDDGALSGLAQRLVRDLGMPAVLAMTGPVSVETAFMLGSTFYSRLQVHGEADLALVEACAGLAERPDFTVPALFSRLGGQPLFVDLSDRELRPDEVAHGFERLASLLVERAPVLEPALEQIRIALLDPTEPTRQAEARGELDALCLRTLDISFVELARGRELPPYDERCPFRGLFPFRSEDREFFFGREPLIERLLTRLDTCLFLAILGASGSGKSSLVSAGLVPMLTQRTPGLQLAYMRPGNNPVMQLAETLADVVERPHILVIDQFEEVFTLCGDEDQRRTFIAQLCEHARHRMTILTMRTDFLDHCAPFPNLSPLIVGHQELLAPLTGQELRRVIERQARAVGLRFEAGLSETICNDIQDEPGAMPLLQHALLELWQRRHGNWLRAAAYQEVGGVKQAIAYTADATYAAIVDPDDQRRVRNLFIRLTRVDEETLVPQPGRNTRRRVAFEELLSVGDDPVQVRTLVARLADARLLVTTHNNTLGRDEVEVAHEALIRFWPQLQTWLLENHKAIIAREGVRRNAIEWEGSGRHESYLAHHGQRLAQVQAHMQQANLALNSLEQDYLEACAEARDTSSATKRGVESTVKPGRKFLAAMTVLVLLGLLASLTAYFFLKPKDVFLRDVSSLVFAWGDNGAGHQLITLTGSEGYYDLSFQLPEEDSVAGMAFRFTEPQDLSQFSAIRIRTLTENNTICELSIGDADQKRAYINLESDLFTVVISDNTRTTTIPLKPESGPESSLSQINSALVTEIGLAVNSGLAPPEGRCRMYNDVMLLK